MKGLRMREQGENLSLMPVRENTAPLASEQASLIVCVVWQSMKLAREPQSVARAVGGNVSFIVGSRARETLQVERWSV